MGENITLYGEFIDADVEVYVVTYVNSNNEVDTPSAENVNQPKPQILNLLISIAIIKTQAKQNISLVGILTNYAKHFLPGH